ncbi:MAG: AAA family ATPase [Solirubrobacteraceae bacterium]
MRVESIKVQGWRNLADVSVDVPADARFVCLVGENGTGKSSILELLTWVAHHLGLSPAAQTRRPAPQIPLSGGSHNIEVTVGVDLDQQLLDALVVQHGLEHGLVGSWGGRLMFWSRGWAGANPPSDLPPGTSVSTNPFGGQAIVVTAGGYEPESIRLGGAVVQSLRQTPALLHLYIDADRVFPNSEVQDHEVLAFSRQDFSLPDWLKNQAAQLTQNLYLEWMRSMLGGQQRLQAEYYQQALAAQKSGEAAPPPHDPLEGYRDGLQQVLPHLRLVRLDHETRRLIFDSAGAEVPYEELSGGERELAFLVGQLDRFGMRDGLFLLDEPELHLNPELLRGWLDYLRSTVDEGQAWVATHSLEAAEVAGPMATLVIERDDDRLVRSVSPLADRPALSTLAAAVGTPAFSVGRSRFVLIEGTRERRERERFATVLESATADRFIEAGGCEEVLHRVDALRSLASQEEQLRIAGIIDRDFRTDEQRRSVLQEYGVHVLSVCEIENLFLQPELVRRLLVDSNRNDEDALLILQRCADPDAGRWAYEKARVEEGWSEDSKPGVREAGQLGWQLISPDPDQAAKRIAEQLITLSEADQARRRIAIAAKMNQWATMRADANRLSTECFGKQVLHRLAGQLGFSDATELESRAAVLWRSGAVPRPDAAREIREYLDAVPVLS